MLSWHSISGQIRHILQDLGTCPYGRSICSLGTYQNTHEECQHPFLLIISHTSQRCVVLILYSIDANVNQLVDTIQDFYCKTFNKPAMSAVLMHCKRELMQAIWLQLLDDNFVDAYTNRMLVECADGTVRRFFPRIFTYSADYPEK